MEIEHKPAPMQDEAEVAAFVKRFAERVEKGQVNAFFLVALGDNDRTMAMATGVSYDEKGQSKYHEDLIAKIEEYLAKLKAYRNTQ